MKLCRSIVLCGITLLLLGKSYANPLKDHWEQKLQVVKERVEQAKTIDQKQDALVSQASILNGLGRGEEALELIETAIALDERRAVPKTNKAKILFSLGRCNEAMNILLPNIRDTFRLTDELKRNPVPGAPPNIYIALGKEDFITATYCFFLKGSMDSAVQSLGYFHDYADPDVLGYRLAWYIILRKSGAKSQEQFDKWLEIYSRKSPTTFRGKIIEMLNGEIQSEYVLNFIKENKEMASFERQEATSEALFFSAMRNGKELADKEELKKLNELSPFGSAEWFLGKQIFSEE